MQELLDLGVAPLPRFWRRIDNCGGCVESSQLWLPSLAGSVVPVSFDRWSRVSGLARAVKKSLRSLGTNFMPD